MAKRGSEEWKRNVSDGIKKRQQRTGPWGGRPANTEAREQARELRRGGATFRELARQFDVSVCAAHYWAGDVTPLDGANLQLSDSWNDATAPVHDLLHHNQGHRKKDDIEDLHQAGRMAVWTGQQEGLQGDQLAEHIELAMRATASEQQKHVRHERSWDENPLGRESEDEDI